MTNSERWQCYLLHQKGMTHQELAEKFGVSRKTISTAIKNKQKTVDRTVWKREDVR